MAEIKGTVSTARGISGKVAMPYNVTEGSTVSVNPVLNAGTKVAEITVDGAKKTLYAPDYSEEFATTNEKIQRIEEQIGEGSGLSAIAKSALMAVIEDIALWKSDTAQAKIDALRDALYSAPLASIEAVYVQDKNIYPTDPLDVLKSGLTVTARYSDGSSSVIGGYTLRGSLTVGQSTITVEYGGKSATFTVTVAQARIPATSVSLSDTTLTIKNTDAVQITATVEPSNTTDTVLWSVDDDSVATVDQDGTIHPVDSGECVITVTVGDKSAQCNVSVSLPLAMFSMGHPMLNFNANVYSGSDVADNKWNRFAYNSPIPLALTNDEKNGNAFPVTYYHPLPSGTHYFRGANRVLIREKNSYMVMLADSDDVFRNPNETVDFTTNPVTYINVFDWVDKDGASHSGECDLGDWTQLNNDSIQKGPCRIFLMKIVVPEGKYGYICSNTAYLNYDYSPGNSLEPAYDMNAIYAIFDDDPSADILQGVLVG